MSRQIGSFQELVSLAVKNVEKVLSVIIGIELFLSMHSEAIMMFFGTGDNAIRNRYYIKYFGREWEEIRIIRDHLRKVKDGLFTADDLFHEIDAKEMHVLFAIMASAVLDVAPSDMKKLCQPYTKKALEKILNDQLDSINQQLFESFKTTDNQAKS